MSAENTEGVIVRMFKQHAQTEAMVALVLRRYCQLQRVKQNKQKQTKTKHHLFTKSFHQFQEIYAFDSFEYLVLPVNLHIDYDNASEALWLINKSTVQRR